VASEYLVELAGQLARRYVAHCAPRAILLAGSSAEGHADEYSDIDMIVYYNDGTLPSEAQLLAIRNALEVTDFRELWPRRDGGAIGEAYHLTGIECEVLHITLADVEEQLFTSVLQAREPGSVHHKAIIGILAGLPLHGDELIAAWRARLATFPEPLARGMVEHHLRQIFPLWAIMDSLERRDAVVWIHQTLAENALHLVGVLAGLNCRYYSTFQFKRAHRFLDSLPLAPDRVADRLDALFATDRRSAVEDFEQLLSETLALVRQHMPQIDPTIPRRPPGTRQVPWR
jgi:hypothetical protein